MATRLSPALEREEGHGVSVGWAYGFPYDASETTPELAWPLSVRVYDQMRRQDAQVQSVLRAVTLPIRRTQWRIDPLDCRPEVVQLVAGDLGLGLLGDKTSTPAGRTRGRFSWNEHLRLANLALAYGHMPFEQVYAIRDNVAHLAKLAVRMPTTIGKIDVNRSGDLDAIEQYPSGMVGDTSGQYIRIPADRLVMYSIDREGGNWQGNSMLRGAYKHWLLKDRLLRVDAMTKERNGMGVPVVTASDGATQAQLAELNKLAQTYRAGEASGGALPYGATLELVGVKGTLPNPLESVKYHDEQIAMMVLAQFLELGHTAHGSRALGAAFIEFFIMALQAYADELATTVNEQVIEDLVDLNFGEDEPAPRVVAGEIGADHEITAQAVQQLVEAGAITNDEGLEDWLREQYRMPERSGPGRPAPGGPQPVAAGRGKVRAGSVPATAKTWPGWKFDLKLTKHYGPRIATAFAGMLSPTAVVRDYGNLVAAAAEPHELDLARAYLGGVELDTAGVAEVIADLYNDGYVAGRHAGDLAAKLEPSWDTDIKWSEWKPGNPQLADMLSQSGNLQQLLDDASVTIKGIVGNKLDQLARVLADGIAAGDSISTVAAALTDTLGDTARAEVIAATETARAMTTASLDAYAQAGIGQKQQISAEDDVVCPECEENADAGPIDLMDEFPNGDPPTHPSCRCAVIPAIDTGSAETLTDEGD